MGRIKSPLKIVGEIFSVGYGEFKKDVKDSYKKLKPKLKRKLKKTYKRKSSKQVKESLGYGRKLNLGGSY